MKRWERSMWSDRYVDHDLAGITYRIPVTWPARIEANQVRASASEMRGIQLPGVLRRLRGT
jgi:hypothetical protein